MGHAMRCWRLQLTKSALRRHLRPSRPTTLLSILSRGSRSSLLSRPIQGPEKPFKQTGDCIVGVKARKMQTAADALDRHTQEVFSLSICEAMRLPWVEREVQPGVEVHNDAV